MTIARKQDLLGGGGVDKMTKLIIELKVGKESRRNKKSRCNASGMVPWNGCEVPFSSRFAHFISFLLLFAGL